MPIKFLDKLTIVIFSYNRHKYLKRTIRYWSNYNVKLLILDGSDSKLEDSCLDTKNIKYIYNPRGLYDRLLSSINYIETEFMILSGDDEFYLPSALSACIKFLMKESSYSCCGGLAIGFSTYKQNIFGGSQYPELKNLSLDYDSASERIKSHFYNYVPAHFYSVVRSSKWKLICKYTFEKEYNFFAVFELQVEFLVMVSGKSKIISQLMWLRNQEVSSIEGDRYSKSAKILISEWWIDKNFKKEKEEFLNRMQKACDSLSIDQNFKFSENEISKLFDIYIYKILNKRLIKKNFFYKVIELISYKKISALISYETKKMIKKFIGWNKISPYIRKSLVKEATQLEAKGVFVNHKDLNQVILTLKHRNNED